MLAQYLPIIGLLAVAVAFGVGSFFASGLLAPRRPTDKKLAPYECGIIPTRDTPERFPVTFFLVAMIFIVFDVEIIFLYPWAIASGGLGAFGLVAILVFSFLVFESFVYLISNGALEWGPRSRTRREVAAEVISSERTPGSTIRRVGLEGREPAPNDRDEPEAA